MKLSECSFLLIEGIKGFNSASSHETLHQSMENLNNILTVAKKNGFECYFHSRKDGFIEKLTLRIPGQCVYQYNINKETITANLKGERDEWPN